MTDIIADKTKEIVSINELVEANDKIKKNEKEKNNEKNNDKIKEEKKKEKKENPSNTNNNANIKIPKMNPLSGMSKNFNKFDIVPGNAMPGMMMAFDTTTWIPGGNQ